ncbi:MAG: TlpA disulfide reductase family protein [Acidobacteriota bacterium]|jgi:peroxiredoxin
MKKFSSLKSTSVLVAMVLGGLILTMGALNVFSADSGATVGQKAPAFDLPNLNGGSTLSLAQFKGEPVVVTFWATWCPPCRHEVPALKKIYKEYSSRGVKFISVTLQYKQTKNDVTQFQKQHALPYPVLWDANNKVTYAYGVSAIPANFVIGPDGKIKYRSAQINTQFVNVLNKYAKPAEASK